MNLANLGPNERRESESIAEFVARSRLTGEEIAWVHSQPVHGRPDLDQLHIELTKAGFADIQLQLSEDRQDLSFKVRPTQRVVAHDNEALLRLWITAFRAAGFRLGFEEIGITDVVDGTLIGGHTLTGPLAEMAEHGAPQIDR